MFKMAISLKDFLRKNKWNSVYKLFYIWINIIYFFKFIVFYSKKRKLDIGSIKKEIFNNLEESLNYVNNWGKVFVIMRWWSWDYTLSSDVILNILNFLWENAYFVWYKEYNDVIKFMLQELLSKENYILVSKQEYEKYITNLKNTKVLDLNILFWDIATYLFFNDIKNFNNIYVKNFYDKILKEFFEKNKLNYKNYYFKNNLRENKQIILCNLENNSLFLPYKDLVSLDEYLDYLDNLWLSNIYINAVINYDLVNKLFQDKKFKNLKLVKYTIKEIINLAKNNEICYFISERNWLNDIFRFWFPYVKQIILYPDSYLYWMFGFDRDISLLKYFFKKYAIKLKDNYSLKWENIYEIDRKDYTKIWNLLDN